MTKSWYRRDEACKRKESEGENFGARHVTSSVLAQVRKSTHNDKKVEVAPACSYESTISKLPGAW